MKSLLFSLLFLLIVLFPIVAIYPTNQRKIKFSYPIQIHNQSISEYQSNLTFNQLTCFYNNEYMIPTIYESIICSLPFFFFQNCIKVWGSRPVMIEVKGNVELLKLIEFPSHNKSHPVLFEATRWLELNNRTLTKMHKEIVQIPAEPIFLCARSNDIEGLNSYFEINFRQGYLRLKDKKRATERILYHLLLLILTSSVWLLPYIVAMLVAFYTYFHCIKYIMILFGFSFFIVCLSPIMLLKKYRQLAKLYLSYYLTRSLAEESKQLIRKQKPLFQALFFACLLLCLGSMITYLIYYYTGMGRELRNTILKYVISIATSWFAFFFCRSFESFFYEWIWIFLAAGFSAMIESNINPLSKDRFSLIWLIYSFVFVFSVRWLVVLTGLQSSLEEIIKLQMKRILTIIRGKTLQKIKSNSSLQHLNIHKIHSKNKIHIE